MKVSVRSSTAVVVCQDETPGSILRERSRAAAEDVSLAEVQSAAAEQLV